MADSKADRATPVGQWPVLFPFVGDSVGGSHLSALLLIEGLAGGPFTPMVAVHRKGPLTDELRVRDLGWLTIGARDPFRTTGRAAQVVGVARIRRDLAQMLATHNVALVHTNDARMHRTWGYLARRCGIPHVWHQRNAGLSRIMTRYARRADELLAVSRFAASTLAPELARRTVVIDNPFADPGSIDRSNARRELLRELGVPSDATLVGFVGSLIPRKKVEVFIDTIELLRRRGHAVIGVVFGDGHGDYADRVKRRIADQQHGCVRLLGVRRPIEPWMAAIDLLMAPSTDEPFSRTLVEASMVATPVIATDGGGNPELIEHHVNGLLVASGDASGFADDIERLLDASLRQTMAERAQSLVRQRFAVDRHVEAVTSVYRRLLEVNQ